MPFISRILFIFLMPNIVFGLPILKTKQALQNIRYISLDGKVTYYQKNSGELQFSTNYNFANVMKGEKLTDFRVEVSEKGGKILIQEIKNPFNGINLQKSHNIYLGKYKSDEKPKLIGKGVSPRIHLDGNLITYYVPEEKSIVVVKGTTKQKIKIVNDKNPYFIPDVFAISPNDIIYTDINKEGYEAIIFYLLADKNFEVLYKAEYPVLKIDLCIENEHIIAGVFPHQGYNLSSSIYRTPLYKGSISKSWSRIYTSNLADIGNLTCKNDNAYFVKTTEYKRKINLRNAEVAKLALSDDDRKIQLLSNLKIVSQIFKLGDMVLASSRGKYYILEGESPLKSDAL